MAFEGSSQHDDLVNAAAPVLLGPASQLATSEQSGFVIVSAKVSGSGMRYLQRDEWNFRIAIFCRDNRRYDFRQSV